MTHEQRWRLFEVLIVPGKDIGPPEEDDYADMVNKDLDRIEPIIDEMLREAAKQKSSNHDDVQDIATGG